MKTNFNTTYFRSRLCAFALGLCMTFTAFGQTLPTAPEIADAMTIGWNLGNTLDATPGGETAWGNPLTSQRLIDSVKAAGFNTVRIPVAWDGHQTGGVIDPVWIARVKTIVDYCISNNMYVIINIHWDGGWLENNVTTAAQAAVNVKQQNYWTQIANYFNTYNERLLFASANEPAVETAEQMAVLISYHQTFINAVRATGGNNASRTLIIQGPTTDIDKTNLLMNTMPTDQIANRLMVEVHLYTPWNFAGLEADASWGNMFYYWGAGNHSTTDLTRNPTWGEEAEIDRLLQLMKTKFVDKGIPVIIGEFGAIRRSNLTGDALALHLKSREYYYNYVARAAVRFGTPLIYWDNGFYGNNGFALFNRTTGAVVDRPALNALIGGTGIVTGTVDGEKNMGIHLFPNPFTSTINLTIDKPEQVTRIVILDMLGNQVETVEPAALKGVASIGSSLKAGPYIIQVYGAGRPQSFKVIKK